MPKKAPYTLGADLEFFVARKTLDYAEVVPAHLLEEGSKHSPRQIVVPDYGIEAQVHWDNAALEFATDVCDEGAEQLIMHVDLVRSHIESTLPANHFFLSSPVVYLKDEVVREHKELQIFGCDPDFDPYERQMNPSPKVGDVGGMRTGGGHLHFGFGDPKKEGFDPENMEHMGALAKCMDACIGLNLKSNALINQARQTMYGRAGAFRPKPDYPGIEYRYPCSTWGAHAGGVVYVYKHLRFDLVYKTWYRYLDEDMEEFCQDVRTALNAAEGFEHPSVMSSLQSFATEGVKVA